MIHSLVHAPQVFFDKNPSGRIINRFSTDQNVVDIQVAQTIGHITDSYFYISFIYITSIILAWYNIFLGIILFIIMYNFSYYY